MTGLIFNAYHRDPFEATGICAMFGEEESQITGNKTRTIKAYTNWNGVKVDHWYRSPREWGKWFEETEWNTPLSAKSKNWTEYYGKIKGKKEQTSR